MKTKTRTTSRSLLHALSEEADALDWYEQRMDLIEDSNALETPSEAQQEEFQHFSANLAYLFRYKPQWRDAMLRAMYTARDEEEPEAEEA